MSRAGWIKHALVFVAAVIIVWLSGVVPVLVLRPGAYSGQSAEQIFAGLGAPTLDGILASWPIFIALAICQALTFHYVKKWTTPIFLVGVFAIGALMAMRYWTTYA
jgi:hypothetical protein